MRKIILIIIFLSFSVNCYAAKAPKTRERETMKEKFVGFMVKTFAKTYIRTVNLKKFKEKNIKKIRKMDEAKFKRVYAKVYREIVVDLPPSFCEKYSITEDMTREKAIALFDSYNKKQMYKMINALPNKLIVKQVSRHRDDVKKTMEDNKVDRLLDKMLEDPSAGEPTGQPATQSL